MSVAVTCQSCGQGAPLLLSSGDPDLDAKVSQWHEDHRRAHHQPPWLLLLVVGLVLLAGWWWG